MCLGGKENEAVGERPRHAPTAFRTPQKVNLPVARIFSDDTDNRPVYGLASVLADGCFAFPGGPQPSISDAT